MICVFVHSRYCPKCHIFKFGRITAPDGREISQVEPGVSAYEIVKTVCRAIKVPLIDLEVADNYDLPPKLVLVRDRLIQLGFPENVHKYWLSNVLGKRTIELPGFLVMSSLTRHRYVSVEIVTEPSMDAPEAIVINDYGAARQCLRAMARTAIEEWMIIRFGRVNHELREYMLERLFPVNEEGKVDIWKWIEGFVKLRHIRVRER